jgi:hypothetical protein
VLRPGDVVGEAGGLGLDGAVDEDGVVGDVGVRLVLLLRRELLVAGDIAVLRLGLCLGLLLRLLLLLRREL